MSGAGKNNESIRSLLKRLVGTSRQPTFIGEVKSVNKENFTAIVLDEGEDIEWDVRLNSVENNSKSSQITFPKVGSYVLCLRVENDAEWVLVTPSEIDEMWLGGDKYSLVKAEILQRELDKSNNTLNSILNILKSWTPPTAPDNGAAATLMFTALKTTLVNQNVGVFKEIINEKIKHGN